MFLDIGLDELSLESFAMISLQVLWGSWCVLGPWHKFYFAGDTGYCHAFEQIGNKFGPFDLAAIPIGSYEPR